MTKRRHVVLVVLGQHLAGNSHYALVLALLLSLVQATVPMLGAARGNPAWMEVARPAAVEGPRTIRFSC